ncbi:ABC transporter substrate-binding protein [Elioraea rosea]|uniref:ABC transporter substrate-binding protein n=1 Tax=Elioraea rosea TaxID=2492390 RepID=UPI0011856820|nr:ABC transporter substrate-binding protein [Elioraea rosea]
MRGRTGSAPVGRRAAIGALGSGALVLLSFPSRPRAQRRAIRIGILVASLGADTVVQHGAEIASELLARRGKPVALRFAETRGGREGADRAATRLLDDGADLLLATCGDEETRAALMAAERRGAPVIAAAASAPGLTDHGSRLLLRTAPTASQLVGRGLGLLRDLYAAASLPLPRHLALVHDNDETGHVLRTTLHAVLPAAHIPLLSHAEIALAPGPAGRAETGRLLAKLREAQPEVIVIAAAAEAASSVVATIAGNGVRPAGIVSFGLPGLAVEEVLALPGDDGEGHVTFAPWPDARSAVTAEVRSLFARRNPPQRFEVCQGTLGLVVDAVLVAGEAASRHPGARGAELAAALRGTVLAQKMMRGPPMRFDARGQNTALPSAALQNLGGRPRVVLPRDGAEQAPAWPNPALAKG